tara:strand:- start:49137 stop:50018 length:882 start_codon:yes stop_codon:yes gene_type:complete
MSLILEALNRARREQHDAAPVPGVDSDHYYPAVEESPWRQRGLLGALAVALLVIGVLLGREFSRDGIEPSPAATVQPAVMEEAPVAPSAAPPVATTTAPETGGTPASQAAPEAPVTLEPVPEPVPEAVPEVSASAVDTSLPQPEAAATAGTGTSAEVAALYQQTTAPEEAPEVAPEVAEASATVPASEEPVDIASLVTAAEQALEDVRLAEHPAPFLGDLSQQRKDAVPTLMYLQHDYRSDGGSTVTINGQQARAGQTVGRGVTVEEVLPDSVVLSHAGQQFRLRALNSWVNL